MSLQVSRSFYLCKKHAFNFVQERVWKKLKGWKGNFMSSAAREVLIKVVVRSTSTYMMSCFKLPEGLSDHTKTMNSSFWWRSKPGKRKIPGIKWNSLSKEKKKGGLGFWTFKEFNLAMLDKQGLQIIQN